MKIEIEINGAKLSIEDESYQIAFDMLIQVAEIFYPFDSAKITREAISK